MKKSIMQIKGNKISENKMLENLIEIKIKYK